MNRLIVLTGPTAVGKTKYSIELAHSLKTELVSADSRQIYSEMSIGTAKPTLEELSLAKHHFIANHSITENYNASSYEFEAIELIDKLFETHENLILTGGSGLYIDAVLYGIDDLPTIEKEIRDELEQKFQNEGIESLRFMLKQIDPESYRKVDLRNPKRILKALEVTIQTGKPYSQFLTGRSKSRNFEPVIIILNRERQELHNRINKRVDLMIEQGLLDEAKALYKHKELTPLKTVGYRELFDYFDGKTDLETAIELIKRNTRRYARRQLTWFRKYESAIWLEINDNFSIQKILEKL